MHYHYVQQEPDDSITTYCEDHIQDKLESDGLLIYSCDCANGRVCVECEEQSFHICPTCGGESEHNWEVHVAELNAEQ